jgi:subtilisin family serine protease
MCSKILHSYLKFLVPTIFVLLLFGIATASSDKKDTEFNQLSAPSDISTLTILSPTTDTILYDNNTALYLDTTSDAWVGVRFTTVAPFELQAIYFAILNDGNNTIDGCSLYVVDVDSLGLPDWPSGVLASLWVAPPLSDMTWMQADLDSPIQFVTNDYFYIIYGPVPGRAYPGTGWWSLFDSDSSTSQRTRVSYDNRGSWLTVTNADAFIRAGGKYTAEFVSDELIVYFTAGTDSSTIDSINQAIGCELKERFTFELEDTTINAYWLSIILDLSVPEAIEKYKNSPNVYFAEPSFIRQPTQRVLNNAELWPADPTFIPGHPAGTFGWQWSLDNWGQAFPGRPPPPPPLTVDADIDAPQMWRMLTHSDVIVGILDTGIDWEHPDLTANIWQNLGEDLNGNGMTIIPGVPPVFDPGDLNGVNNDGDPPGLFQDDVIGWDCVAWGNNPTDPDGHGTHVAGIVGAVGGNGVGVTGVCWSVNLMPVRVLGPGAGIGAECWGIIYTVNKGARILNMSLGGPGYSFLEHLCIFWAQLNDVLVVAAAGNAGVNVDLPANYEYPVCLSNPAAIPLILGWWPTIPPIPIFNPLPFAQNIIGVAASDYDDAKPGFSNWGAVSVHLAAPGHPIYSTVPHAGPGPDYNWMSGTSMAAPHVSGVAALCWTLEPWLTYLQLKRVLLDDPASFNAADKEKKPAFQLGGASPVVTEGRLRAAQNADFGDAPDPPYPTFWPPLGWGALHLDCGLEWLGYDISLERDALDLVTDTDGIPNPNLIDNDGFDDGVTFFPPYFCKGRVMDRVDVEVRVSNPISGRYGPLVNGGKFLYLSSFFDFNGDGDWGDVFTCLALNDAPEHLLIQAVGGPGAPSVIGFVPPPGGGPGNVVVIDPSVWGGFPTQQSRIFELYFYSPPAAQVSGTIWSRFRLEYDDQIWPTPNNKFLGTEFDYSLFGEVEDYVQRVITVQIPTITCPFPGDVVDITVNIASGFEIGGFKLYVEYDPTTLTKLAVERGDLIDDFSDYYDEYTHTRRYKFQYFEHRQLPCEQQCETYKIKIVGIADMPDGWTTGPLEAGKGELIRLKFQVAKDANLQDMFLPVKFEFDYDFDPVSNSFSSATGESLFVDIDWPGELTGPNYDILPIVAFIDGGIKVHSDAWCWCGDINMNELPYEIADAVLFANALLTSAEEAFTIDYDIQVLATDVNKDGFVLSIADFVFLVRIILEDISPKHKLVPSTDLVDVTLTTQGDAVKVTSFSNSNVGAGLYVFKHTGEIKNLTLLTDMDVKYSDVNGELKVLVYSFEGKSIPAGNVELFSFQSQNVELVEIEAADFYGSALKSTITTKVLPTRFALMNNYPNPFNLSTNISFALPVDSKISLKLYNVTGQLVKSFEDRYEAGVHTIVWDGTNTKGEAVSSGIYFYKLVAGDYSCTKKMVLVK